MSMFNKLKTILLALAMVVVFKVNASAGEVYTAAARGYYHHPVTKVVEDPGNNPGIGEGMVNNVVYGVALIEKDDDGKLYATVRYNLRDNIKDIAVWVQNRGDGDFAQVPVKEIANAGKTGDFRFEIPSADCVVKSSFFVGPMGRSVIFFMDFDDLQEGGGNGFKISVKTDKEVSNENRVNEHTGEVKAPTSVTVNNNTSSQSKSNESSRSTGKSKQGADKRGNKNSSASMSEKSKSASKPSSTTSLKSSNTSVGKPVAPPSSGDSSEEKINQADLGYDHGLLTNKDFNDSQSMVGTNAEDEKKPWGPVTRALFTILIVMVSIVLTLIMLGAIGLLVLYKHKKAHNLLLEEELERMTDTRLGGGSDD